MTCLLLVFDGGSPTANQTSDLRLADGELAAVRFFPLNQLPRSTETVCLGVTRTAPAADADGRPHYLNDVCESDQ